MTKSQGGYRTLWWEKISLNWTEGGRVLERATLTAWIGVGEFMSEYRAIDACKADSACLD